MSNTFVDCHWQLFHPFVLMSFGRSVSPSVLLCSLAEMFYVTFLVSIFPTLLPRERIVRVGRVKNNMSRAWCFV
jgi:hypothetical protein